MSSPAGSFLPPGFFPSAPHLAAIFGMGQNLPAVGELRNNGLMDYIIAYLQVKNRFRQLNFSQYFPLLIVQISLHISEINRVFLVKSLCAPVPLLSTTADFYLYQY